MGSNRFSTIVMRTDSTNLLLSRGLIRGYCGRYGEVIESNNRVLLYISGTTVVAG